MFGWLKDMDAAAVRALHVAKDLPIGSRGAPPDVAYQLFVRTHLINQMKRTGLSAAKFAWAVGPTLLRTAADRRERQAR